MQPPTTSTRAPRRPTPHSSTRPPAEENPLRGLWVGEKKSFRPCTPAPPSCARSQVCQRSAVSWPRTLYKFAVT
eukprot:3140939-Pleurochrysis_carterae.AAC.2